MTSVVFYVDGGSRGNPGEAGYGIHAVDAQGMTVVQAFGYLGKQTNNYAEYRGFLEALKLARALGLQEIEVRSDSELLVRQVLGVYKVKSPALKPLHEESRALASGFRRFAIRHIRRELNAEADGLANRAMNTRDTQVLRGE